MGAFDWIVLIVIVGWAVFFLALCCALWLAPRGHEDENGYHKGI